MRPQTIYDDPHLYDEVVRPGPCDGFYRDVAAETGGPVLELACGTGRLTIPLARDGHDVTGLDASPSMLRAAQAKAGAEGVSVLLRTGDMRSFSLGRRFRLVLVTCNSLAHLESNDALVSCLSGIREHLAEDGILAFDIVHPRPSALAACDGRTVRLDLGINPSSGIPVEEEAHYDPVRQVRTARWRIGAGAGGGKPLAPLALRQIFPQELELLLQASGLRLTARYGDFARRPLSADSLNQICLARRAAPG